MNRDWSRLPSHVRSQVPSDVSSDVPRSSSSIVLLAMLVLLGGGLTASCGSGTDLGRSGSPEAVAAALNRLTSVPARPVNQSGRPIAYLALGGTAGSRLAAFDLEQSRMLWSVPAQMTGRVVAGTSIIVYSDGETLVAREVAS